MTPEEDMKEELLMRLCCGDRCMEGVDRDGGCERWAYSEQAEAILAETAAETSAKLSDISKWGGR